MRSTKRAFTEEFKRETVKLLEHSEKTLDQLSVELGWAIYFIRLESRIWVTRGGFYKWLNRKGPKREPSMKLLKETIEKIHIASRGEFTQPV